MKKILYAYCENIADTALRNAVMKFLEVVPEYFWTIPASSTGKYHPSFSLGEGGLVRHTVKALEIAKELSVLQMYSDVNFDIVYAALIIHDSYKLGDKGGKYYDKDHAMTAANHWLQFASEYEENGKALDFDTVSEIFECVLWHMGQWSGKKTKESYGYTLPFFKSVEVVHLCDYLSSKKSIFLEE